MSEKCRKAFVIHIVTQYTHFVHRSIVVYTLLLIEVQKYLVYDVNECFKALVSPFQSLGA